MERLPAGVTGFASGAAPAAVDDRAILGLVHETARRYGRTVQGRSDVPAVATYRLWSLVHPYEDPLSVLIHSTCLVVAVKAGDAFVDWPPLAPEDVSSIGWRLLTADEAAAPVKPALIAGLGQAEIEQIRYWQPATVADLVFNHWD